MHFCYYLCMIEIKNLNIKYIEKFYSIYNLNLKIEKNTLLIGDQLSGDYALLRAIANINKNYKGEILLDNKPIKKFSAKRLNLAYLPETPTLFGNLNVQQNIEYTLKIRKYKKAERDTIIENILQKYDIKFENEKAKNLSLSQAKIVALLRAIVRKPSIILIEHLFADLESEYVELANKIIADLPPETLIIDCEIEKQNCHQNFDCHTLQNGSLLENKKTP